MITRVLLRTQLGASLNQQILDPLLIDPGQEWMYTGVYRHGRSDRICLSAPSC
nr:MAG TPA: hypothetical protein [Microviridae sp.]